MSRTPFQWTRRRLLQGAAAPALLAGCGPGAPRRGVTLEAIHHQNALIATPLAEDRLARILPAVRLNHAFFRPVRALEIGDLVEPAVRFHAGAPGDPGILTGTPEP